MTLLFLLLCSVLLALTEADITGQDPPAGSCICLADTAVNVRSSPCGTIIGSASTPQCFTGTGKKQGCTLSGVYYEYFAVQYGSQEGWMAGNYLVMGSSSDCSGSGSGTCAQVEIVSRAEWGAVPPAWVIPDLPNKPVGMGFVHHTVTAFCYTKAECSAVMRSIQSYHMDTLGWPDIGYNYLVGEDGRAYEGRGWDKEGAHTYGYNDVAVAVSTIGDFTSRPPNDIAQAAIKNTFDCAIQAGVLASNYEMFGHRDGGCTACPGDAFYPVIQTWPQYSFREIPVYCRADGTAEV